MDMHGFSLNTAECLCLLTLSSALICLGDQSLLCEKRQSSRFIDSRKFNNSHANQSRVIQKKHHYIAKTAKQQEQFLADDSLRQTSRKNTPIFPCNNQLQAQLESQAETQVEEAVPDMAKYYGWYYSLQSQTRSTLTLNQPHTSDNNNPAKIDRMELSFLAESPQDPRWGSLQLRARVPLQQIWQQGQTDNYPVEIQGLKTANFSPLLPPAYHSNLYLRWGLTQSRPAYLQAGCLKPRDDSLWHIMQSSIQFPGPMKAFAGLSNKNGKLAPSIIYDSDSTIGENQGLSWDGQLLQAALLHQRGRMEESLISGLGLRVNYRPNSKNQLHLRTTTMFTQNLSQPDSHQANDGDWYFSDFQVRQNPKAYSTTPDRRWTELVRYDRAVQQYGLQASWQHSQAATTISDKQLPALRKPAPFWQLSGEQTASLSPWDYLGIQQRYCFNLQAPIYAYSQEFMADQVRQHILTFSNQSYIFYRDAHWVDARRRLPRYKLSSFYGRRWYLQNQLQLRFRQKHYRANPDRPHSWKPQHRNEQILKFDSGAKIVRSLLPTERPYLNFGLRYTWLYYPLQQAEQKGGRVWHLSLGSDIQQQLVSSNDIRPGQRGLPDPPWKRCVQCQFGWQQKPPTRIPKLVNTDKKTIKSVNDAPAICQATPNPKEASPLPASLTRLGWRASLSTKEQNLKESQLWLLAEIYRKDSGQLYNLQSSVQFSLFWQFWRYDLGYVKRRVPGAQQTQLASWWKLIQLQLDLGPQISFVPDSTTGGTPIAQIELRCRLKAELRFPSHWFLALGIGLDEWQWPVGLKQPSIDQTLQKVQIELTARYEFYGSGRQHRRKGESSETAKKPSDDALDPLEQLQKAFGWDNEGRETEEEMK